MLAVTMAQLLKDGYIDLEVAGSCQVGCHFSIPSSLLTMCLSFLCIVYHGTQTISISKVYNLHRHIIIIQWVRVQVVYRYMDMGSHLC